MDHTYERAVPPDCPLKESAKDGSLSSSKCRCAPRVDQGTREFEQQFLFTPRHRELAPEQTPSPASIAASIVSNQFFRRRVETLCRLPRLAAELLAELAAERGMESVVRSKLDRYCSLPASVLAVTGGDRFPPTPLHEVLRCCGTIPEAAVNALPSVHDLAVMLADQIDALVPELFPAACRSGGYWQVGNVDGDAGRSLYVHRDGVKAGRWTDAATGQFGDPLDLVNAALFAGQDRRAAFAWVRAWLGLDRARPGPAVAPRESRPRRLQDADDEAAINLAQTIWRAAQPAPGTKADTYLRGRAICCPLPPTLRFAPALRHFPTGAWLPALLAAISGPDGQVTAVQRIYLRPDGLGKAGVSEPKRSLGRMRHGACRLAPAERELGLAEGVETGFSAMELHGIPVWAACGSRMDAIAIPDAVERLVIFADNGRAGAQAAERAATQHARPGRAVEIKPPPPPYKDWNDVAKARTGARTT
jgi:Toprim domain